MKFTETLPLPPVVRIEPASACNLKCTHCPTGVDNSMARTIMKPDLFERVLGNVVKHVPPIRVAVLYHGGEPFLNKHFLSMARRVKDIGIPHVKTVINGMLIEPGMCDAIVGCGLDAIEFSLDAESPAENDAIRVNCDFNYVCEIIHRLVEANRYQGRPIEITVSNTQFQKFESFTPGREAVVPAYLRRAFADIADEIEFKVTWAMLWPSQAPSAGFDLLWDDAEREEATACSFVDETMTIRANGDVVPCCRDITSMSVMGNVKEQSLNEIWNGPGYREFRSAAGRLHRLCKDCVVVVGDKFLVHKDAGGDGEQKVVPISSLGTRTNG